MTQQKHFFDVTEISQRVKVEKRLCRISVGKSANIALPYFRQPTDKIVPPVINAALLQRVDGDKLVVSHFYRHKLSNASTQCAQRHPVRFALEHP